MQSKGKHDSKGGSAARNRINAKDSPKHYNAFTIKQQQILGHWFFCHNNQDYKFCHTIPASYARKKNV